MEERIYLILIALVALAITAISGFGYGIWTANAIQGLHNRYDVVIPAHVLIPPATSSTPGQGHSSEIFSVNATSIDFGSVSPGANSALKGLDITNLGITSVKVLILTDLNTPGVTLVTGQDE